MDFPIKIAFAAHHKFLYVTFIFSQDISFHDLGLVIIDEEHRFGVKQKEKIKAKSAGVHTLMLSATPIPRTLNQSLSSLRDISLIDTPPRGRTRSKRWFVHGIMRWPLLPLAKSWHAADRYITFTTACKACNHATCFYNN